MSVGRRKQIPCICTMYMFLSLPETVLSAFIIYILLARENVRKMLRARGVILLKLYSINQLTTFNPVGVKTSFPFKPIH